MKATPRQRVANQLRILGYRLNDEDIKHVHGGIHKRLNDTIQCWSLFCGAPDGTEVEIQSAYTLTLCARGFRLIPNTPESDLYGDLLAIVEETKKRTQPMKTTKEIITSTFTNKAEYLVWREAWRTHYAALTQQIRKEKSGRKSKDATERSLAQCHCFLLRREATALLEARKASKLKAQEQYLAGHALPVPAA